MRILVVDDEKDISDLLALYLHMIGHSAQAVYSAEEGLNELNQAGFDAMITDVDMPGMNGIDLIREVRKRHGEMWVIVSTGYRTVEVLDQLSSEGVHDIMFKPFNVADIEAILHRRPELGLSG